MAAAASGASRGGAVRGDSAGAEISGRVAWGVVDAVGADGATFECPVAVDITIRVVVATALVKAYIEAAVFVITAGGASFCDWVRFVEKESGRQVIWSNVEGSISFGSLGSGQRESERTS